MVAAYWRTNLTMRQIAALFGTSKSAADHTTRNATVIADGGYHGTRAHIPHRRTAKDEPLIRWKEDHNASHRTVRARVEHTFASMKVWKVLRDCRLRGNGVAEAMAGIARLHNLTITS